MRTSQIGARLKKLRLRNRFTVEEVAKHIGVAQSTYREWEYGRLIKGEPYEKMAEIFGTSLTEIITGKRPNFSDEIDRIDELIKGLRRDL